MKRPESLPGARRRWFTSDWHLGHQRIIDLCERPFATVDEMNETIISNVNDLVTETDELWLLGDICMGKKAETIPLLSRLRCNSIVLVAGNHDPVHPANEKRDWKRMEWFGKFNEVGVRTLLFNSYMVIRRDWGNTLEDSFEASLCHFPPAGDHTEEDRYAEWRPPHADGFNVHGHVHDAWKMKGRMINVGVDVWDFLPVEESTLWAMMDEYTRQVQAE